MKNKESKESYIIDTLCGIKIFDRTTGEVLLDDTDLKDAKVTLGASGLLADIDYIERLQKDKILNRKEE